MLQICVKQVNKGFHYLCVSHNQTTGNPFTDQTTGNPFTDQTTGNPFTDLIQVKHAENQTKKENNVCSVCIASINKHNFWNVL